MYKWKIFLITYLLIILPPAPKAVAQVFFKSDMSFLSVDSARSYYLDGLVLLNTDNEYKNNYEITKLLQGSGNYLAAIFWSHLSLTSNPIFSDKPGIYDNISTLYKIIGDYFQAINYKEKAILHVKNENIKARIMINTASLYSAILDYAQGINTLDSSIHLLKQHKDIVWIAIGMGNKGIIYTYQNDYRRALSSYQEAYNYVKDINAAIFYPTKYKDNNVMVTRNLLLNNIADVYVHMGLSDSGLFYLAKTEAEWQWLPEYIKAGTYITYAEAYALQGKHQEALSYFRQGLEMAERSKMHTILIQGYKGLAKLYGQTGDFHKAWIYQKRYLDLYEPQTSAENIHKINQLRTSYLLERKDKEIVQTQLDHNKAQLQLIQKNNQLILVIVTISLSTLLIALFLRNQYNKNRYLNTKLQNVQYIHQIEATLQGEENERERIAQELHDNILSEVMAMQLNLDELPNTHPTLVNSDEYDNIIVQAVEVADKLRVTSHNLMPAKLQEHGLAKTIESFVVRISGHKLNIDFQCFGEKQKLDNQTEKILLSIVYELTQNIIKHAKASDALIQLNYYEDTLELTVEDNGVGIREEHIHTQGLGWNNIRKNIAAISGSIHVKSSDEYGTTVLIEVPI